MVFQDGEVRVWSSIDQPISKVGDALMGQGMTPVPDAYGLADSYVLPLPGPAKQVAWGGYHACAVLEDGDLYCWGYNASGQLGYGHTELVGDDETPEEAGPVDVGGTVVKVAIGRQGMHTCALLETGDVRCFGAQREDPSLCGVNAQPEDCAVTGALGTGTPDNVGDDEVPAMVPPVALGGPAVDVAVTAILSCAVREDGQVFCWGKGAPGDWDQAPVEAGPVPAPAPASKVVAGWDGLCMGGMDGVSWWCGGPPVTTLGLEESGTLFAVPIHGAWASPIREASIGKEHACFLLEDRSLRCIGNNYFGALGYGDIDGYPTSVCPDLCSKFRDPPPFGTPDAPTECCKGDDEPLSELPPVPYE